MMTQNQRELLIDEICQIQCSQEREQSHFERMFEMTGHPRYKDWANLFGKNYEILDSLNWEEFHFTQETMLYLYKNLSYSCACDIAGVAYQLGLDNDIDYDMIEMEIRFEEEERELCD